MSVPLSISGSPHPKAEKLEEIYAKLPKLDCQKKCQTSCGPIGMFYVERQRIEHETGELPDSLIDVLHKDFCLDKHYFCPLLTSRAHGGECSIHTVRPLICRLWGLVEKMKCEHGCKPEKWVTDEEAQALMNEIIALDDREKEEPC